MNNYMSISEREKAIQGLSLKLMAQRLEEDKTKRQIEHLKQLTDEEYLEKKKNNGIFISFLE